MEEKHKIMIQRNHSELMNNCNFRRLLPKLVEKNVFSWEMAKLYKECDEKCNRTLLFDIPGRGPEAFQNLVSSLRETDQHYLANRLLGLEDNTPARVQCIPFELPCRPHESWTSNLYDRREPLRVQVIHSTSFKDDFTAQLPPYMMRSEKRGAVLIINNKHFINHNPRNGAQFDEDNLKALFQQMGGYSVTLCVDLDATAMKTSIENFAKSPDLKLVDVMFVIIMSHGNELCNRSVVESVVECINGETVSTFWIENQFYGDKCPNMQNKPKIIIYQICRGINRDHGVSPVETDGFNNAPVRTHADMLICHSTPQGYKAHRNIDIGSWYIQSICENFMRYAHEYHVEDLLRMVDENLRELQADNRGRTMQTANFHNTGFRHCYLNPGIYEDNGQLCRFPVSNT